MTDERLGMAAGTMLRSIDRPPRDPEASVAMVMTEVRETRQVRRWWPFGRITRPTIPASGRPPARGSTMFSALKFIAAGVIVALFGGFLLAGVLTTQPSDEMAPAAVTESPSPMTSEELLSSMITEEVEPGVFRVINDGVRDIGAPPYQDGAFVLGQGVAVDAGGSVWRVQRYDEESVHYFRLGEEAEWSFDPDSPGLPEGPPQSRDFEITPDGGLVAVGSERHLGLSPSDLADLAGGVTDRAVQGDGTVWLLGHEGGLARVRPDGTIEFIDPPSGYEGRDEWIGGTTGPGVPDRRHIGLTKDGEIWLVGRPGLNENPIDGFLHFDGDDWEVVPAPAQAAFVHFAFGFDVGPSGTLWSIADTVWPHRSLARYDGSEWTVFGEDDGVQPWGGQPFGFYGSAFDILRVAPDASAWVNAAVPGDYWSSDWREDGRLRIDAEEYGEPTLLDPEADTCDGLGRFDGTAWSSFLPGMCIGDYDFAPDGAVWVVAQDRQDGSDIDTFVITPEAVAAREATGTEPPPVKAPSDAGQPSTTTEALLSGMVTEEVEPGVHRVLDDGVGHAMAQMPAGESERVVYAGPDGAVWVANDAVAWRLGIPGSHERSPDGYPGGPVFDMGPDGTLWNAAYSHFASYDGDSWTAFDPRERPTGGPDPGYYVDVTPDGTAWVSWHNGSGRIGQDAFEPFSVEDGAPTWAHDVWVMPDGVYAVGGPLHGSGHRLVRLEDGGWQEVPLPDTGAVTRVTSMRPGPDDDLWVHLVSRDFPDGAPRDYEGWWAGREHPDDHLARFDGESWTLYSAADGVPVLSPQFSMLGPAWDVHPDGTVWMLSDAKPTACPDPDPGDRCNLWNLVSFDGGAWTTRADGVDGWFQVGPDGTVWAARSDLEHGLKEVHLASFDGTAWSHYPDVAFGFPWFGGTAAPDNFADGFDTSPDGTAWILAPSADGETDDLYVITPEAVGE